ELTNVGETVTFRTPSAAADVTTSACEGRTVYSHAIRLMSPYPNLRVEVAPPWLIVFNGNHVEDCGLSGGAPECAVGNPRIVSIVTEDAFAPATTVRLESVANGSTC